MKKLYWFAYYRINWLLTSLKIGIYTVYYGGNRDKALIRLIKDRTTNKASIKE